MNNLKFLVVMLNLLLLPLVTAYLFGILHQFVPFDPTTSMIPVEYVAAAIFWLDLIVIALLIIYMIVVFILGVIVGLKKGLKKK